MQRRVLLITGGSAGSALCQAVVQALVNSNVCIVTAEGVPPVEAQSPGEEYRGRFTVMDDARENVRNHQPSYRVNFKSGKPLRY
jgi:hypothetical protein